MGGWGGTRHDTTTQVVRGSDVARPQCSRVGIGDGRGKSGEPFPRNHPLPKPHRGGAAEEGEPRLGSSNLRELEAAAGGRLSPERCA